MAKVTYNGKLPSIQLVNYGHFAPGDTKTVDEFTALQLDNDLCRGEGWTVELDHSRKTRKSADSESNTSAAETSRRSHRTDE